jgi:hypothetical protein
VSPTAVGEEKGSRDPRVAGARRQRDLGGSGEHGRDEGRIIGASREAVGSWGEMAVADARKKEFN